MREYELATLKMHLLQGDPVDDIARRLRISQQTVRVYKRRLAMTGSLYLPSNRSCLNSLVLTPYIMEVRDAFPHLPALRLLFNLLYQ